MRARALAVIVGTVFAFPAFAQVSEPLASTFDGPAGFLMTSAEQHAWKAITDDDAARRFVDLFWARRDPDLSTWVNEFKIGFDLRVATADQLYGYGTTRGAMSDRGRVLEMLGSFDTQYEKPRGTDTGDAGFTQSGTMLLRTERPALEIWEYRGERFPELGRKNVFYAIFVETQAGQKDFVLDRANKKCLTVVKLLGDRPQQLLLHPELKEPPAVGMVEGSRPATEQELAWLTAPTQPWPEGATAVVRRGVVASAPQLAWVHLSVPEGTPPLRALVGRVSDVASGRVLGTFRTAVSPVPMAHDLVVEEAIPIEPGRWYIELALAGDDGPIAVTASVFSAEPVAASGTVFAPLVWGATRVERASAPLGTAFVVGGWHVLPRAGDVYRPDETLSYLGYVLRPVLGADGQPQVDASLVLSAGGRELLRLPAQRATLAKVRDDLWMFGGALPLSMLTQPGRYTLEVVLTQAGGGVELHQQIPLTITKPKDDSSPAVVGG